MCIGDRFGTASKSAKPLADRKASKAASFGAKTVKGPGPCNVSTRLTLVIAATKLLSSSVPDASPIISSAGTWGGVSSSLSQETAKMSRNANKVGFKILNTFFIGK